MDEIGTQLPELGYLPYPYDIDGFIFMPTTSLTNINSFAYKEILKYKPIEEKVD